MATRELVSSTWLVISTAWASPSNWRLRIRNADEAYGGGNLLEILRRVEMPRQMQGRQHRSVDLNCPRPEAPGHVMDQIERLPLTGVTADKFHNFVLVLAVAPVKIIGRAAWLAGGEQLPSHREAGPSPNRGFPTTPTPLALQSPQHL